MSEHTVVIKLKQAMFIAQDVSGLLKVDYPETRTEPETFYMHVILKGSPTPATIAYETKELREEEYNLIVDAIISTI